MNKAKRGKSVANLINKQCPRNLCCVLPVIKSICVYNNNCDGAVFGVHINEK